MISIDANHLTKLPMFHNFAEVYGYTETLKKQMDALWDLTLLNRDHSIPNPILVSNVFCLFEKNCFDIAKEDIGGYSGPLWSMTENGVYCFHDDESARFEVSSPNQNQNQFYCNALEASLYVSIMAIGRLMYHKKTAYAQLAILYREYLVDFVRMLRDSKIKAVDTSKIFQLID